MKNNRVFALIRISPACEGMEERSDDGASRRPAGPCLLPQAKDGKAKRVPKH